MSDAVPETMRAWRVHAWGDDPVAALQFDEVPVPEPGPGELLVRVQAIPLNLNDLDRITGTNMMARPELPVTPGMEVMGQVAAAGDGVEDWVDRRVVAMAKQATGGFAEYAGCPVVSAFEMPEDIELPGAAALYFPFHLAWLGLMDRGRLRAGESVLIHAAAGGAGSAAVQLAKHRGATVYATAGSAEKVALARGLGADLAIDYTTDDFQAAVLDATDGRGVDVVFDTVGEAVLEQSMACTAYNGRYLMIGFASDKRYADEQLIVPRRLATGNLSISGVLFAYADQPTRSAIKGAMGWNFVPDELGAQIMRDILDLVRTGAVRPIVGDTIDFAEIPTALTRLRDRQTVGRTVAML